MNDLDLVRTVLDEVPPPSADRLAAGRARLLASATGKTATKGRTRTRRVFLPAGLAAGAAAAAAAVLAFSLAGSTGAPAVRLGTRPSGARTPGAAELAAKVLGVAARAVAAEPATEPGPHQWIYYRTITTQTGSATTTDNEWTTFDGVRTAYYGPDRQLIVHDGVSVTIPPGTGALAAFDDNMTPLTAYNALAALPSSPAALLAAVNAELARTGETNFGLTGTATTAPQREFAWLGDLLWNAYEAAPPSALAAVYRTIATIPGVSVDEHVTDAAGRPAIGITDNQGQTELLLSPAGYQPSGLIIRNPVVKVIKPSPGVSLSSQQALASPVPQVTTTIPAQTTSLAIAQVAEVDAPGQR